MTHVGCLHVCILRYAVLQGERVCVYARLLYALILFEAAEKQ